MISYGPLARWYDELTSDVPYGEFADFYEAVFKERGKNVNSILDLACGTGTLTMLLAGRGYDMTAVDISPDMLSMASEKAVSGQKPLFIMQDISELDLFGTVDAAVCSLDGINFIKPERLKNVFDRLRLFIEPGGLLIFDIHSPERLRELGGKTFVDEFEDVLCLWRSEYNQEENYLFYGMDLFVKEGSLWRRENEELLEYAHAPDDLAALMGNAGFSDIEIRRDGPKSDEGRLFIIAENSKGNSNG
jgi:SAM-dependent methyltransferase